MEDLECHIDLGLEAEALEMCKGVVLGLYRVRDARHHDLLAHAEDFPDEAAGRTLEAWHRTRPHGNDAKRRRQRPEFPPDFVDEHIPGWKDLVNRTLRQTRR